MATSPVRIREADKRRLARLQHDIARTTGGKPSQEEVLHRLVEFAASRRAEFLAAESWQPLPPSARRAWSGTKFRAGDVTSDIDAIVYGDDA